LGVQKKKFREVKEDEEGSRDTGPNVDFELPVCKKEEVVKRATSGKRAKNGGRSLVIQRKKQTERTRGGIKLSGKGGVPRMGPYLKIKNREKTKRTPSGTRQ